MLNLIRLSSSLERVLAMSTAKQPAAATCGHYSQTIRIQVCETLNIAIGKDQQLRDGLAQGTSKLRVGSSRDGPVARGLQLFKKLTFADPGDAATAQNMDKQKYNQLINTWAKGYFDGTNRECKRRRTPPAGLSAAQKKELCYLLSTPEPTDHGPRAWRSLEEALESHPKKERILELVTAAGMSHETLIKDLMATGRLTRTFADKVPALAPRTRSKRQQCAAIWRGEVPWLGVEPGKLPQPWTIEFELGVATAIWFTEPWNIFRYFTFIIDASSKTDEEGPSHKKVKAFYDPLRIFPPEETRRDQSGTDARKIMWYIVIHPILGLVVGPDFMYWGSTPTRTRQQHKAAQHNEVEFEERHHPDFPHWCAPYLRSACRIADHHACSWTQC